MPGQGDLTVMRCGNAVKCQICGKISKSSRAEQADTTPGRHQRKARLQFDPGASHALACLFSEDAQCSILVQKMDLKTSQLD